MLQSHSRTVRNSSSAFAQALIALRHRPNNCSIASYVLDLRCRFPLFVGPDVTSDGCWRDRTLALEEEINTLKRKFEEDLAVILRSDVREALKDLGAETNLPKLNESLLLFSSFQKLLQTPMITSSELGSQTPVNRLFHSANQVLQALGNAIRMIVQSQHNFKDPLNAIRGIDVILRFVLTHVVSICSSLDGARPMNKLRQSRSQEHDLLPLLELFFGTLALDLVIPIVKSFDRLYQEVYLSISYEAKHRRKKSHSNAVAGAYQIHPDIQTTLYALLKGILPTTRLSDGKLAPLYGKFSEAIVLSAVAEIARLWTPIATSPSDSSSEQNAVPDNANQHPSMIPAKLTRRQRVHRLARKDAIWHLCAITRDHLSFIMTNSTSNALKSSGTPSTNVIQGKYDKMLSNILVTCKDDLHSGLTVRATKDMSKVERGMAMGIIEMAWLGDFSGCHILPDYEVPGLGDIVIPDS
ncbi:hypothetical protein M0805_006583 [Coniferiporia weirii]|nr:hypothetical protein M0805_006583 [Coniferiporia weirii]